MTQTTTPKFQVKELTEDDNYVEIFILKKILTPTRANNRIKKLVALDDKLDVVGLMSYRLNTRGVKRINTVVFDKAKGYGTEMVKHLCRMYPDRPQYSINIPAAFSWVIKMGMTPGKVFPDGKQEFYWTSEEVKAFGEIIDTTDNN